MWEGVPWSSETAVAFPKKTTLLNCLMSESFVKPSVGLGGIAFSILDTIVFGDKIARRCFSFCSSRHRFSLLAEKILADAVSEM